MIERTTYDEKISMIKNVVAHYNNDMVSNALLAIENARENFELKVLLVGHFNAGKSSLINSFIGRNGFLKEDQGETTAIAAELRYSDQEIAYAYDKNMNQEEMEDNKMYLPNQYDHLTYFLSSDGLKKIEDYVLVDTPGFDSALENHTRALSSYLKYGLGFIMVIDVEKGGLDAQTLSYLYEISQYSNNVTILVNKCDKQIDSEVEKVVSLIKNTLTLNGFNYPVYSISKYDSDIVDKLSNVILTINAQKEFDKALNTTILSNVRQLKDTLSVLKENQFLDTYEYDEIIRIQERSKEQIRKSFVVKKKDLLDNLDNDVQEVINRLKAALFAKADEAANAIENGSSDGLQAIIVDTVRPVLIDLLKSFSVEKVAEISKSLTFSINKQLPEERGLDDIVLGIGEKINGIMESGLFLKDCESIKENESKDGDKSKKKTASGTGLYTLITGVLSITTNAIAPWMEIIIILLPEIVAGLKYLFGESNHSKLKRQYESEIVPKVTNTLWPVVRDSYTENVEMMISLFESEMDESMKSILQIADEAHTKKNQSIEEYNLFKQMIEKDIVVLNDLITGGKI